MSQLALPKAAVGDLVQLAATKAPRASAATFKCTLPGLREKATVRIDRISGLVTVRPYRRRRVYQLHLGDVAEMVVWRVTRAELAEAKRAKGRRR